jgi:hypothetical protein
LSLQTLTATLWQRSAAASGSLTRISCGAIFANTRYLQPLVAQVES